MNTLRFLLMSSCLALTSTLHAQTTTILPFGSTWRYLDNGSNQGTAWRASAFDDSTWATGPAQLGYGNGDEATVTGFIDADPGTAGVQKNATTYFRTTFNVPDPTQYSSLRLTLMYDDGGAVFVNGTQVARTANLAANAVYNTFANPSSSDNAAQAWPLAPTVLEAGLNTIAVEIHQASATSTDISFDLQILGIKEVTREPYLQMNNATGVTIRWRTATPSDSVVHTGTIQGDLSSSTTNAAVTTDHLVRVEGLQPDTKYFYAVGSSAATLIGGDAGHYFRTAPEPGTDRPARIWVLGDSGTKNSNQQIVRNAYYQSEEYKFNDLVLLLGDNAYNTGTDLEYQTALFDTYSEVLRQSPVWSCLGNHETAQVRTGIYPGVPYFDIFSFPTQAECGGYVSGSERYFSWDFGNIHFISLDAQTNDATLRQNMLAWLDNDLAANTRRWTIAFWHHPPYTKGSHNSDTESQLVWAREQLVPRIEEGGVDLVVSGHSHCYERSRFLDGFYATPTEATSGTFINPGDGRTDGTGAYGKDYGSRLGTVYVVAGSSGQATTWFGGSTAPFNPTPHPVMHHSALELGSLVLDVDGNRLDAKFINSTGAVSDYFSIEKGPLVTVETPSASAAEYGPVPGEFRISRSGSTANPLEVQAVVGGTAPGSRHAPITVPVVIPAGASTHPVEVLPIPDSIAQGAQTVTLEGTASVDYRLGAMASGVVTITDTPAGAPPIATWHLEHFGSNANNEAVRGDHADPDSDGMVNLLEYAFGLDPLVLSTEGGPMGDIFTNRLRLRVQKNPLATDVSVLVQVNSDLSDSPGWTTDGLTLLQDTPTLLEVLDNVSLDDADFRFLRVKVTRP